MLSAQQALERVRARYDDPMGAARASGLPVVGLVGPTVPYELVLAAGCFPVLLTGRKSETSAGDRFMEPIFDPELRQVFDALLTGAYGPLALTVIPRASDQYNKLYLYLREVSRLGQGGALPPLELYDMLHTQTELNRRYGLERTRELAVRLGEIGAPVTHDSVSKALEASNRLRVALSAFQGLRDAGALSLSPGDALRVLSIRRFEQPEVAASLIETITAGFSATPDTRTPRVLLKGFPLHHPKLHALANDAGITLVAEDDWWGARAVEHPIDPGDDAIEALFRAQFETGYSIRMEPRAARDRWFSARLAQGGLDGVLFYIPPFDDVLGWDYPGHRNAATAHGLATHRIEHDIEDSGLTPSIQSELRDFASRMKETRHG